MNHDITVISIHEFLLAYENQELGEKGLKELFAEFFCSKNKDVEQFLKEQSIEFTKKNQSVTYLLFAKKTGSLLGYFTLAIKPISLKAEQFSNTAKRKIARVSQYDEINKTYTLSAYLIAQLGKNFAKEFYGTMTDIQEKDKETQRFYLAHKSFLVNIGNVREIDRKKMEVVFYEDHRCPISRLKTKKLRELMAKNQKK